MASYPQVKKVAELIEQGYVVAADVAKREKLVPGGPSYLRNPKDNTVVEVDAGGSVKPYKPTPKSFYRPPFGPL